MAASSPSVVPATLRIHSSLTFSSIRHLQIQQIRVPFSDFTPFLPLIGIKTPKFSIPKICTRAAPDSATPSVVQEDQEKPVKEFAEESVTVLKNAAKTRKVPAKEVLSAFSEVEKAKFDPSAFLETLGGNESPGRTWMLVFTAKKGLESGKYFPITAIQRFDAAGKRIENGVYLGSLGCLTFEGRISWKKRILAFVFERIRIKIGPLNPFEFSFKGKDEKEPNTKDPFFIWFYVDEEIAVARGRSGGHIIGFVASQVTSVLCSLGEVSTLRWQFALIADWCAVTTLAGFAPCKQSNTGSPSNNGVSSSQLQSEIA